MRHAVLGVAPALVLALASQAFAQATPSTEPSAASPPAAAPRPWAGGGPGGMRGGMGPRVGSGYTPGWSMMTSQEREAFHDRMLSAKTAGECQAVVEEHRKLMNERAAARGTTMRRQRMNPCAGLPG